MRFTALPASLKDPLKSFRMLQIVIAMICVTIPLILKLSDKDEYYPSRVSLMTFDEMSRFLSSEQMDSIQRSFDGRLSAFKLKRCDSTAEISAFARICKDRFGFRE